MKNSTHFITSKNHLNMEASPDKPRVHSPSGQSIRFILSYSRSLEAQSSKYMKDVLLNLN